MDWEDFNTLKFYLEKWVKLEKQWILQMTKIAFEDKFTLNLFVDTSEDFLMEYSGCLNKDPHPSSLSCIL